jgi:transcriptional regulator with XRE-family HTH domain
MDTDQNATDRRAGLASIAFGSMIRGRRKALGMRQDQLALATGVGRRFLIELESGKPSCQLGRSLLVAEALGLSVRDLLRSGTPFPQGTKLELPDLPEPEESDAQPSDIF